MNRVDVERELREQARVLAERVKELNCLYAIAKLVERVELDLHHVLAETVEIVPHAWLHAEVAGARITLGDRTHVSRQWRPSPWVQHAPIIAHGQIVGAIEVGYPTACPEQDEGPFLTEERALLNVVAQRLGEIVERKEAEQQLLDHQQRLRSLARQLVCTEDRERRRIARDLHDRIGQTLATARIQLGMLATEHAEGPLGEALSQVREHIATAIQDTRTLIFDLSPPVLHEFGLGAALEWLTEEARRAYGLTLRLEGPSRSLELSEELRSALFRSARELVANVARHAQVAEARITLTATRREVRLSVADEGVGFEPERVRERMLQTGSFGLFGLRERLEQLGGQVDIETAPGRGTRVTLRVPREPAERTRRRR